MEQEQPPAQRRREGSIPRRSRRWSFTINNPPSDEIIGDPLPRVVRFIVWQRERGQQGTEHLQGYVEFDILKARTAVARLFVGESQPFAHAHLEPSAGTAEENIRYCTKEDGRVRGPWRFGEPSGGQGTRNDLRAAATAVATTGSLRGVEPHVLARYFTGLSRIAATITGPFRPDLRVISLIGSTGIGKSFAIRDRFDDVFVPMYGNGGLWFEGYNEQKVLILEEFRGQIQLQRLLALLDPYPQRVECKGGSHALHARIIFITSNSRPQDWYEDQQGRRQQELNALKRRLGCSPPHFEDRYIEEWGEGPEARQRLHEALDTALVMAPVEPGRNILTNQL